jgi:hypothetical protein
MKIPVFVSAPTQLNANQQEAYDALLALLDDLGLERRALGRSDYPTEFPLKEVMRLAKKCSGGLILGFVQQRAPEVINKPGTSEEASLANVTYPTPWNHLEAGILFSLKLPILVFREDGVRGGIFDNGVSDVFVHKMPTAAELKAKGAFREVILKWQATVRQNYYEES